MVDFAALPPEVNSTRIYAGAGAGPLVAAATAWDGLASELTSVARSYQGVVSELTSGSWLGPSSAAAAAAAAPYVSWISTTAATAEETADQARSAVAAYETAFAATVPPAVIAANRATLATLVATNILGQNTPAIAANEATYAEFWAQDAATMYGYAGAAAAATQLPAFTAAPQTTNTAGSEAQSAAVSQANSTSGLSQLVSQVPSTLQSLASSGASTDWVTELEDFLSDPVVSGLGNLVGTLGNYYGYPLSGLGFVGCLPGFFLSPLLALALPNLGVGGGLVSDVTGSGLGSTLAGSELGSAEGAEVAADLGRAASVGGLSVPQAWGGAAPEIRLAAKALPLPGVDGLPEAAPASPGFFGGIPPVGSVVNAPRNGESRLRSGTRPRVIPALVAAPGVRDDTLGGARSGQRAADAPGASSGLSERERDELDQLRKELAELEMERDAAARLIKEAIRP